MSEPHVWTIIAVIAAAFASFIGLTVNLLTRILNSQLARLGDRMDRLDARMDKFDTRMDKLDARMDRLDSRVESLGRDVQRIARIVFRGDHGFREGRDGAGP